MIVYVYKIVYVFDPPLKENVLCNLFKVRIGLVCPISDFCMEFFPLEFEYIVVCIKNFHLVKFYSIITLFLA